MCNTLKRIMLVTCTIMLMTGAASAETFTVDAYGDPQTTFENLDTALATAEAWFTVIPHTILILEGEYGDANLTVPLNVGQIIGEPGVVFTSPTPLSGYLLDVSGTSGLEIAGLAITEYQYGIRTSSGPAAGLLVHGCELYNNFSGLYMNGAGGAGSLYDNIGHDNTGWAFHLFGNGWSIYDNCFYGNASPQVGDDDSWNNYDDNYYSDLAGMTYVIGNGHSTDPTPVMSDNSASTVDDTPEVWDFIDVDFNWIDGKKCDPTSLGLAAYTFTVNFDETVLEYQGGTGGFDPALLGDPDPATYVLIDAGAGDGQLVFDAANTEFPGFGDGRLAFAQFKVVGLGNYSITISSTYLDGDGDPIVTGTTALDLSLEDNTIPTITLDAIPDVEGDNTFGANYDMVVSGDVHDNWDLYRVYYQFDGGGGWNYIAPNVDGEDDTYGPHTVDLSLITGDGSHTLNMRVRDQEGNFGYVDHAFTLDNTGPAITGLAMVDPDDCANADWTSNEIVRVTWDEPDDAVLMQFSEGVTWLGELPYEMPYEYLFAVGNGNKTLYVKLCDAYGNWSSPYAGPVNIELDQEIPVPTDAWLVTDGATPAKTNTRFIEGDFNMGCPNTAYFHFSENIDDLVCFDPGWASAPPVERPFVIELDEGDDGMREVFMASMDSAGNIGITSAVIELDTKAPEITTLSVTDITGSECSDDLDVTVRVQFTDTDVTRVRLSVNNTGTPTGFTNFNIPGDSVLVGSMTVTYTLPGGVNGYVCDDLNVVEGQLRDDIQNWGLIVSDDVHLDCSTPSAGAMLLNGGDTWADDAVVVVTVSGMSMDIDQYRAAETALAVDTATWFDFDPVMPEFSYDFGSPAENAWISLHVQFRDCADRESGKISDDIIFDLTVPVVSVVEINSLAAYTNSLTVSVDFTQVEQYPKTVSISEASDMSGATTYPIGTPYTPFELDPVPGDGSRTVWVTLEDQVGHVSAAVESAPIIVDLTDPVAGTFLVISANPLAAAGYTDSRAAGANTYSFTPDPVDGDIKSILIRNEDNSGPVNGGWFDVSGTYPETGPLNAMPWAPATCTIEWYYRDLAGNQGGPFEATINWSSTPPTSAGLGVVSNPLNSVEIEVTNPGPDDQFYFFRYNYLTDYPIFADGTPPHPAIDEGHAGAEMGTGNEHIYATSWLFEHPEMSIFAFSVWVVNNYGNTSAVPNQDATAVSTNYYRGDFDKSGVLEFVEDFGELGVHYGLDAADFTPEEWLTHAHCDFATDITEDPLGIAIPDGLTSFPDLLVFAQNYAAFGDHLKDDGGAGKISPAEPVEVVAEVQFVEAGEQATFSITVSNSSAILAYQMKLKYNGDQFEVVSVTQGAMHNNVRSFFYHNTKTSDLQFEGAVMGDQFEGNEIARITVRALQSGVFELTDPELTLLDADNDPIEAHFSVEKSVEIPKTFALSQNYPNPFNPSTTIQFSLPMAADYSLVIYNVTGQVVASFSGHAEAGITPITWDASNRSSGVYFYRLEAGSFTDTKKMVMLK